MIRSIRRTGIEGPWICEKCGCLSQYADVQRTVNRIFCKNPSCDFTRIIDKRLSRIVEDDGTVWEYDGSGNKRRVRA